MKNSNKYLRVIVILLILCTFVSISYAYFKVSNSQNNANSQVMVNAPSCAAISFSSSSSITIQPPNSVPVSDAKALSATTFRTPFVVKNNCTKAQSISIILVPQKSSTMPVRALKYALIEQSAAVPSSGTNISSQINLSSVTQKELSSKNTSYSGVTSGYFLGEVSVPASSSKSYYLYVWIDENEGWLGNGSTMDKKLLSTIIIGTGVSTDFGDKVNTLYETIENRYKNSDTYVKLYDPTAEGDPNTYPNNIYYFNGAVKNNNVLFGGFCWKIVRTTDTGGIKMIYNGVPELENTPLVSGEYTNINNDTSNPFTFDSTNNIWSNSNATATATISFNVSETGVYILNYSITSKGQAPSYFNIFIDGTDKGRFSGNADSKLNLGTITSSNTIKITYNNRMGSTITFNLNKIDENNTFKTCDNTNDASQLTNTSAFNSSSVSPAYVGYMYNTVYTFSRKSMSSQSNIVFGNTFTYANGTYTLSDTKTVATWSSGYNTINSNHYTCFTTGTTCTSLYYVHSTSSGSAYYITLTGGKSVDDALNEMLYADDVNKTDSTIKTYIDSWYKEKMTSYTDKLEDTVFCNDRTISNQSVNGWNPNGGSTETYINFENFNTNYSLACTNETDRFSMSNSKAKLTYPVGLLSAPEVGLAYRGASSSTFYLNTGNNYWLASPNSFDASLAYGSVVANYGSQSRSSIGSKYGVLPAISLKPGTGYTVGDGSYTKPFVVE